MAFYEKDKRKQVTSGYKPNTRLSPRAPKRKQAISWKDFIRAHMEVLVGTDFFTVEVLTLKGLVTYYVLFFIHLESRRVSLAGNDALPGPGVDGTASTKCNHGGVGISERLPLPVA